MFQDPQITTPKSDPVYSIPDSLPRNLSMHTLNSLHRRPFTKTQLAHPQNSPTEFGKHRRLYIRPSSVLHLPLLRLLINETRKRRKRIHWRNWRFDDFHLLTPGGRYHTVIKVIPILLVSPDKVLEVPLDKLSTDLRFRDLDEIPLQGKVNITCVDNLSLNQASFNPPRLPTPLLKH